MITPRRAPVRPRAFSAEGGEALLLEDEIRDLGLAREGGLVAVLGPARSGKTTALEHLAAVLPAMPVVLLEAPEADFLPVTSGSLAVYAAELPLRLPHRRIYQLAPWTRDDFLEYLLAVHRDRCAAVLSRIRPEECGLFGGSPELWRIVLDQLAGDLTLSDPQAALEQYLRLRLEFSSPVPLRIVRARCLHESIDPGKAAKNGGIPEGLIRLLVHPEVRLFYAGEQIAEELGQGYSCNYLRARLPLNLVQAAARAIGRDAAALHELENRFVRSSEQPAMAVSILHAAGRSWRPEPGRVPDLAGAYLAGVVWQGVSLQKANLEAADLRGADLVESDLGRARAGLSNLSRAHLRGSCLDGFQAAGADLSYADLTDVYAENSRLIEGKLVRALCDRGYFKDASFRESDLSGASFVEADLSGALFVGATLREVNFTGANLEGATFDRQLLREATWTGARLRRAIVLRCDLEYVNLANVDFEHARLTGTLLTGCVLKGANLRGADLRETGLADIDAEGACLRDADLRGGSFHLGSTRGGLVGSPIACEGSRTGFYTDDYEEQHFKAPEEIRKANLCRADLRGAKIEDVDFYLVDLRGALYDRDQEKHFRRCRAILEARV
jgi:uncharacterized protein YjbI with pentapeptide repeats